MQAFKPKTNYPTHASSKQKFREIPKMTGQPKDTWLVTRAPHSTTPQVHGQNRKNKPVGKAITNITNVRGTEGTAGQETWC